MGIGKDINFLMNKIGYSFSDITYLETALTHISYTNEMRSRGFRADSNESLEFLGDAVLQIVISEELYDRYKRHGEGMLTKYRQNLVCEATLAAIATEIELGDYLNIGTGEESMGIRASQKVLADAFEALIAAVYMDDREYGIGAKYRSIILMLFKNRIDETVKGGSLDYKTMLQQFVEKDGDALLTYEYEEYGPEHSKMFTAIAYINNNKVGVGSGRTKRAAEMQAAKSALALFGII